MAQAAQYLCKFVKVESYAGSPLTFFGQSRFGNAQSSPLKTAKPNPAKGFGFAYAVCGAASYLVISTTDDWGCSVTVTTPFLGRICIDRFSRLT